MITKMMTKSSKSQDHFMITKMMTFKNEFKIESRTLQGSRGNLISRIKIQDSKIQESREDLIKISIKKFFKTLSSTRSFL